MRTSIAPSWFRMPSISSVGPCPAVGLHVAGSGIALVQMGNANLNPWTEAKVNTKNPTAVRC